MCRGFMSGRLDGQVKRETNHATEKLSTTLLMFWQVFQTEANGNATSFYATTLDVMGEG